MIRTVEAVYEHGILRPLEPLSLPESKHVRLVISDAARGRSELDVGILERARAEAQAAEHIPGIEEVRAALATVPGSLSQDVIAERGYY